MALSPRGFPLSKSAPLVTVADSPPGQEKGASSALHREASAVQPRLELDGEAVNSTEGGGRSKSHYPELYQK